jgi:hypothetical protein
MLRLDDRSFFWFWEVARLGGLTFKVPIEKRLSKTRDGEPGIKRLLLFVEEFARFFYSITLNKGVFAK